LPVRVRPDACGPPPRQEPGQALRCLGYTGGGPYNGEFAVRRQSEIGAPSREITVGSARSRSGDGGCRAGAGPSRLRVNPSCVRASPSMLRVHRRRALQRRVRGEAPIGDWRSQQRDNSWFSPQSKRRRWLPSWGAAVLRPYEERGPRAGKLRSAPTRACRSGREFRAFSMVSMARRWQVILIAWLTSRLSKSREYRKTSPDFPGSKPRQRAEGCAMSEIRSCASQDSS